LAGLFQICAWDYLRLSSSNAFRCPVRSRGREFKSEVLIFSVARCLSRFLARMGVTPLHAGGVEAGEAEASCEALVALGGGSSTRFPASPNGCPPPGGDVVIGVIARVQIAGARV